MDTDNKGVLSRFAEVKRDLDPAFGYVVFEEPLGLPNSVLLKGVPGFLSKVEKGSLNKRFIVMRQVESFILWPNWTQTKQTISHKNF